MSACRHACLLQAADSSAVTVKGLSITVTKTRANLKRPQANYDGHWGVHHSE